MRFLTDREQVVAFFFRGGSSSDNAAAVTARFQAAFGITVGDAEAGWLEMLRTRS